MSADPGPIVHFPSRAAWARWLDAHAAKSSGVWLRLDKKKASETSEKPALTYAEAVEVALCHGWIDGQKRSLDESAWLQRFTPRGPKSIWSKLNRGKADALIARGEMKPAGLAAVRAAQRDGRWAAAYDSPRQAGVPADLQVELDRSPRAKAFFATLDSRNRYAILFRIQNAKKAETRAKRIRQFVEMLRAGKKLYP
jgi:uncharacterized protein YdeI (YjbR/CyaY-like superfamily)